MPIPDGQREDVLLELLDGLIRKGAALSGDVILSLGDVDLVRVHLQLLLSSTDSPQRNAAELPRSGPPAVSRSMQEPSPPESGRPRQPAPQLIRAPDTPRDQPSAPGSTQIEDSAENAKAAGPQNGLAQLVVALADVLRRLMEREALRKVEAGTLDAQQLENLGTALSELERQIERLKDTFRTSAASPDSSQAD